MSARTPNPNPSLTPEPLLLNRVDARQLTTAPVHVVHGAVEQRQPPAKPRQCRPGLCEGLHTCADHACEGHPVNRPRPEDRSRRTFLLFWLGYIAVMSGAAWATWQWLSH